MEKTIFINGVETNYIITSDGKVFNTKNNKELKGTIQRNEYKTVQLTINNKPKSLMVHRLVAEAFINNPNNYNIVDHIDKNKMNNNVENLRWVDSKANAKNIDYQSISRTVAKKIDLTILNDDQWKTINDNYPQYKINSKGEIINIKTSKYVLGSERNGYRRISIGNKAYSIHRLVWEIFRGPIQEGFVIDHIDGNRSNNNIENLRAVTQKENMDNAQLLGHGGQKEVIQCDLEGNELKKFCSIQKAADEMGVTHAAIRSAINRNGSSKGYKWKYA